MANSHRTTRGKCPHLQFLAFAATDKCEHKKEHASCEECNPIFKDEAK